jgi:hypothetical protein
MAHRPGVSRVENDLDKIDEITVALLWLISFKHADGVGP